MEGEALSELMRKSKRRLGQSLALQQVFRENGMVFPQFDPGWRYMRQSIVFPVDDLPGKNR